MKSTDATTRPRSAACGAMPESITATPMPRARDAAHAREACPDLVGARRLGRHAHALHGDVARQVRDIRILAERLELAAGHLEHRAAADAALQPRAIPERELIERRIARGDDHVRRRLHMAGETVRHVARQPRTMRSPLRLHWLSDSHHQNHRADRHAGSERRDRLRFAWFCCSLGYGGSQATAEAQPMPRLRFKLRRSRSTITNRQHAS